MQRKHFIWTVGAALVVVIGAGIALTTIKDQTAASVSEIALFPDLAKRANDVAAVKVVGKGNVVDIRRDAAGAWSLGEKAGYPVPTDKIAKLVFGLAELKATEPRTDNPANYDKLGVGDATKKDGDAKQVTLTDAAGKDLAAVIVGKVPSGEGMTAGGLYVRKPGEARAWLAQGKLLVETDPLRWLDREVVRIKKDQMAEAVLTGPNGSVRLFRPDPAKSDFVVAGVDAAKLDPYAVSRTMSVPEFLDFDDVRKAGDIDFTGSRAARYTLLDKSVLTLELVKKDDKWWGKVNLARPADAPADEAAAAQVKAIADRAAGWAYQLNQSDSEPLTRDQAAFLKKDEPNKTQ